mmetsp:Transcript_128814/g.372713  ORF Transcript_128814/g.372713 Transcript_128814/m.372713 type:complete len:223 (-) Transcript_128814:278-946(-)
MPRTAAVGDPSSQPASSRRSHSGRGTRRNSTSSFGCCCLHWPRSPRPYTWTCSQLGTWRCFAGMQIRKVRRRLLQQGRQTNGISSSPTVPSSTRCTTPCRCPSKSGAKRMPCGPWWSACAASWLRRELESAAVRHRQSCRRLGAQRRRSAQPCCRSKTRISPGGSVRRKKSSIQCGASSAQCRADRPRRQRLLRGRLPREVWRQSCRGTRKRCEACRLKSRC